LKNLEQYIAPLLEQHDCVIIPGFGGFLLNHKPAGFAGSSNEIHPQSKIVSFNRNLNINDGLLAQYIALEEHVIYQEALNYIDNGVEAFNEILNSGKSLKFPGAGALVQNAEQKRIFSPDYKFNHLVSSFGLPSLLLTPVEKPAANRVYKLPDRQIAARIRKPVRFRVNGPAISMAASLIILFLVFFQNAKISHEQVAQALHTKHISTEPIAVSLNAILAQSLKTEQPQTVVINPVSKFYVVGGSFKNEANAHILEKRLKKKGFLASVLNTENGFYRVTYLQERDSTKADMGLHKIKISENQAAWLLKW
jgi:nucleoid DNA-binding protein